MNDLNNIINNLRELTSIDSPSGYTNKVVDYVEERIKKTNLKCFRTNKGNLIVEAGKGDKVLGFACHIDTLGLMVRSINCDGTLKFTKIGGPQLNTLDGEYCRIITRDNKIYTGTILSNSPAAHVFADAKELKRDVDNMHVRLDEIVTCKEDVTKLGINAGDIIAYDPKTTITESGFIKSRFLDDKMSAAILLQIIDDIASRNIVLNNKVYFIFSTYEEVGHGCGWVPSDLQELISVDMGCVGLDMNCTEQQVSICAKDSSGPYDYNITSNLINLAKENNIPYAVDIYPFYSSDVSAALRGGSDIRGGLIGPAIAASHGMERTHIKSVVSAFLLVKAYINK